MILNGYHAAMMLAEWFKTWRWAKQMTIRDAAKKIGIGFSSLHRFESGKPISEAHFASILRFVLSKVPTGD